jgi:MoaA/NifB/PqqE/SkfB family radical SAM enzyme
MCDLYGRRDEIESVRSRREKEGQWFDPALLEDLCGSFGFFKPTISLCGGEPLLHPRIVEMVECVKRHGLTCSLVTNGTLLADKAEALVAAGIDSIIISIDGPEELHDDIRGMRGAFAKALDGARALHRCKKAGKYGRPRVRINCTIMGRNYHILSKMADIAERFHAESLLFSHLWFWDKKIVRKHNSRYGDFCPVVEQNTRELERIEPEIIDREIKALESCSTPLLVKFLPPIRAGDLTTYYRSTTAPVGVTRCRAVWLASSIMPDGEVIPCLDYKYGNLRRDSFRKLWNNGNARRFRRRVRASGIFPGCVRCCMLYSF